MTTFMAPPDQTSLFLNRGDVLIVKLGGVATNTKVLRGIIEVLKGGKTIGTTIDRGLEVDDGMTTGTTLNAAGNGLSTLLVQNGGTASHTVINGSPEQTLLNISPGGASFDTIINGGVENVESGGTSTRHEDQQWPRTRIWRVHRHDYQRRHRECRNRGTSTRTTIHNGGVEDVGGLFGAGTSNDTTIDEGGIENVRSRGKSTGTTIHSSGIENVAAGGKSTGTTIHNGGIENVAAHGTSAGTTIHKAASKMLLARPLTRRSIRAASKMFTAAARPPTRLSGVARKMF